MKYTDWFPYFTRSQRRAVIVLFIIILTGQGALFLMNRMLKPVHESYTVPQSLQRQYDSLKNLALQSKQKKIYPFNPNYLTDYRGYYLGMTTNQIDKVIKFRKQGNFFQSKQQFKQISGISDSLFMILEPYINIPVYKLHGQKYEAQQLTNHKLSTDDINQATASDFQTVRGVGTVLSKRIVKYRSSIGGFTSRQQLNKVYGLSPEVIARIWQKFKIKDSPSVPARSQKIPVNTAHYTDLMKVNGINEKLAKRIIKYRDKLGGFAIREQLGEVYGINPVVQKNFWNYFKIENPNKNFLKIDLNEANIKELSKNPYISYQLAKKIVSYRTLNGAFHTFDDLLQVEDYPTQKHKLICLYLKIKND